jgi:hypothetical protein
MESKFKKSKPKNIKRKSVKKKGWGPQKGKRLKKGGASGPEVEVKVGPLDTVNHKYLKKDDITTHIQDMDRTRTSLDANYKIYKDAYDKERQEKARDKQRDFLKSQGLLKEQSELDKINMRMDQQISEKTTAMLGNVLGSAGTAGQQAVMGGYTLVSSLLVGVFSTVLALGKGTAYGINVIGFVSGFLINTVGSVIGSLMKNVFYWFFKFAFQLIFAIIFFVLIILLCVYGVSIFTKKSSPKKASGGGPGNDPGCSSILTDSLNVNISGLKITNAVENAKQRILEHKPTFDFIPDYDFSFTNFIKNPAEFSSSFFTMCANHPAVKKTVRSVRSTVNNTQESVNSLTGNASSVVLTDRTPLATGRCDNSINIDTKLLDKKSIIPGEIRNSDGTVLNIAIPKNIEWLIPESASYNNRDITKLPKSLLDKKDASGVSLNDRKSITIPWVQTGNEYRLSCGNAYFSNNPNEKADILIDNDDLQTCTFNNSSLASTVTESKKRCNDSGLSLDTYLTI